MSLSMPNHFCISLTTLLQFRNNRGTSVIIAFSMIYNLRYTKYLKKERVDLSHLLKGGLAIAELSVVLFLIIAAANTILNIAIIIALMLHFAYLLNQFDAVHDTLPYK